MAEDKVIIEEVKMGAIPAWMVTFSDLTTLLLTFFVLLLSMSSMDDKSLKSLFTNFTSASGILNFKELGEVYRPKDVMIDGIYDRLKDTMIIKRSDDPVDIPADTDEIFMTESGGQVVLQNIEGGFKLVFGHKIMFESGKAEIKDEIKPILDEVAKFIKASYFQIYIDGHTDDLPINNEEFPSNTILSLTRAYNVMRYLIEEGDVDTDTLALGGYGEKHPIDANDTQPGRERNRRVEMIFKSKTYF
ncbi:MAG: flagellar motor protein MotB [Deltaproteobacteria bacterium]|nr:flagellar motor protein MotB [Deltaproteobacteria bacterium]